MALNSLRKRFTLSNFKIDASLFKLHHDRPSDFVHSVISESTVAYAIMMTCASIHTLTMSIFSGMTSAYKEKILIWLTYWSFFVLTARFLLSTFNTWAFIFNRRRAAAVAQNGQRFVEKTAEDSIEMPILYKVQWILQNVSNCSALIVSFLYWLIMYRPEKTESVRSIHSHGLNMVFVVGDILLSRAPVRIHHFIYPFFFIVIYVFFSVVYWAAGGTNHLGQHYIYSLLDYSGQPGKAVFVAVSVAFVGVPLLQTGVYLVFRFRQWYSSRWCRRFLDEPSMVYTIDVTTRSSVGGDADKKDSAFANGTHAEGMGGENSHATKLQQNDENNTSVTDEGMDLKMEELGVMRHFRPTLHHNVSEVSTTDSTKALLN